MTRKSGRNSEQISVLQYTRTGLHVARIKFHVKYPETELRNNRYGQHNL